MKHLIQLSIVLLIAMMIISCKKDDIQLTPLVSLRVITAVIGGSNIKLNNNARDSVKAYNSNWLAVVAGKSNVYLYPTNDSLHPYFNNMVQTNNGEVYSIYIAGQASTIDTLIRKENLPAYFNDSTIGV